MGESVQYVDLNTWTVHNVTSLTGQWSKCYTFLLGMANRSEFPDHSHSVIWMDVAVCRLTLLPKFPMPVFSAHWKRSLSSYIWHPKGMQLQAGIKQFLCQTDYTGFSVRSQLTPSFFRISGLSPSTVAKCFLCNSQIMRYITELETSFSRHM